MKKIIALFIAVIGVSTAFSQSSKIEEVRRVINGEPNTVNERRVESDNDYRYNTNKKKHGYKHKANRGKKIGWTRGKGNPHRTGNWKGKKS